MALWVCGGEGGCGTKYAVGLSRCPRCHNEEFYEDGDPMAKISRNGGATGTAPAPEAQTEAGAADVPAPKPVAEDLPAANAEGGEESSPGSSSETSTRTQPTPPEPSEQPTPSPAPTTGNRSREGRTARRTARSTDGGQEADTSATGSADA